jgi:hypothetical protein
MIFQKLCSFLGLSLASNKLIDGEMNKLKLMCSICYDFSNH